MNSAAAGETLIIAGEAILPGARVSSPSSGSTEKHPQETSLMPNELRNRFSPLLHQLLHPRHAILLLLAVIVAGAATAPASAQGTSGMLPDPISSSELTSYADRLGLSGDQRRAIGQFYEQYHERFRTLRDGEIDDFLESMRGLSGFSMPERNVIEEFIRDLKRVQSRIRALDESFFADIQVLLTDRQRRELPRIQMARERQRHAMGMMMMMPGGSNDLSTVLMEMDLSQQEREAIDGLLLDYETRLTRQIGRASEAGMAIWLDMYDAMADLGFEPDSFENADDPEEMQEMMEAMQQAMQQVWGRISDAQNELRDVHIRAYRNIAPALEEDNARSFRNHFVRIAFPTLGFVTYTRPLDQIDLALSLEEIDGDLRGRLEALRAEIRQKEDRLFRDVIALGTEHPNQELMVFGNPDEEDDGSYQEKRQELTERSQALASEAQRRFREAVTDEQLERVNAAQQERYQQRQQEQERVAHESRVDGESADEPTTTRASGDQYVAGRMTRRTMTIFAEELGLDESAREELELAFQRYLERHQETVEPRVQEIVSAQGNLWKYDAETGESAHAGPEAVRKIYAARRTANEHLTALDEELLSFIRDELLGEERSAAFRRIERMRTRERHVEIARQSGMMAMRQMSFLDLDRLARTRGTVRRHLDRISDVLAAWEEEVAPLLAESFEQTLQLREVDEALQAEMTDLFSGSTDMSSWREYHDRRQETVGALERTINENARLIRDKTFAARDEILDRLPSEVAEDLERLINRRLYPELFSDRTAMHDQLEKAFELPDLADRQRSDLAEISMEYRVKYRDLTEALIEIRNEEGYTMPSGMDQEQWAAYQELQSRSQRLQFDRDELNARVIRELEGLLTETQIQRLGGLPRPERTRRRYEGF